MVRNVAVVGHLHHGKTALMDMLVFETHKLIWDADKPVRKLTASAPRVDQACHRFVTRTHTFSRDSVKSLSNHLLCLLSSEILLENRISYISLIRLDTLILLTRLPQPCVLQTVYYLS